MSLIRQFILIMSLICLLLATESVAQQSDDLESIRSSIVEARNKGDMDNADILANQLLNQAQIQNRIGFQGEAFYQLARNAMERNQYDASQALLNRAIEIFQEVGALGKLANAYRQLGLTYRYQVNYSEALEYIYRAMQIFQQLNDKASISNTYNSIGVVLERMGQFEESLQAHQKALELNYELENTSGVASSLYNIGDIRRKMGDDELALKYFKDVLKIDQESGNQKDIAYTNHKIGRIHLSQKEFNLAREHINRAFELFKKIQTPRDTDWALNSLAELEMELGNLLEAKKLNDAIIQRAIKGRYRSLLVIAYELAIEIDYRLKDYMSALLNIEAALKQVKVNQEKATEARIEALSVKVYLAANSLEDAFAALQRQKTLEDEILNNKRLDAIARAQAQTEFVRRAQQIKLLEKEKALEQSSRNLWFTIIIAAFVSLFLLYGRYMQKRTNRKLSVLVKTRTKELEVKNQQLAKAYQEMEAISLTDKLTAIHNRRFLENHINADLEQSHRVYREWRDKKTAQPRQSDIVVFVIDMDNFKQVNDQYGHNSGDMVLIQLAQRMADVFRQSDYLVRWGGEEFVAVARFIDRDDATSLAQRMLQAVSDKPFILSQGEALSLTCSIGFASYPPILESERQISWRGLVSLADACLYAAKTGGKNTWIGVASVSSEEILAKEINQRDLPELIDKKLVTVIAP
ncbi:diguanylate cyclase [Aliikangiella marina]|uniref:diguanylate cyclase n=1 Tax=Aliikangiella marina TaxID=1712262 RepID=UPI00163D4503|nr:diguanylate cyclase [Aliikangiella marina]